MTLFFTIILFRFILKNDNLLRFTMFDNLGFDLGSIDNGGTYLQALFILVQNQYITQFNDGTFVSIESLYPQNVSFTNTVLLSTGPNYSIHSKMHLLYPVSPNIGILKDF